MLGVELAAEQSRQSVDRHVGGRDQTSRIDAVRHSSSSSANGATMTASLIQAVALHGGCHAAGPCAAPMIFIDFAAELVPQPGGDRRRSAASPTIWLSRSRGQPVVDDVDEAAGPRRHHADAVGQHRRLVERMRDQQHGRAGLAPQPQQLVAHQQPGLLVERAERLVEQDQPRLQHQRAGDADALAHAAGQLRRIGAGEILAAP